MTMLSSRAADDGAMAALVTLMAGVDTRRVARLMAALVLVIVAVGAAANVVIYNVAPSTEHPLAALMKRFDLGHEPSIPNWYSSLALLAAAILLGVIAKIERLAEAADVSRWAVLAAIFLYMAVDEAVLIHEMADRPMQEWLGTGGYLYFAWVIPYSVLALLTGLFFLGFVLRLDPRQRRLFVASGCIYVTGAVGVELLEGAIVDEHGLEAAFTSLRLTIAQTLEETLEMLAIVLFIYALLERLKTYRLSEHGIVRAAAPERARAAAPAPGAPAATGISTPFH